MVSERFQMITRGIFALGLILAMSLAAQAVEQGKKNALPPAVEAAFKKAYPNAKIKATSTEKEGGKTVYEIESVDGSTNRDLIYLADGTLQLVEEEITASDLPAPVVAALKSRYPKATVWKYEKITHGTAGPATYEMQMKGAGVAECEIAADGTFISPKPSSKK
jgi:hypothetical protein